ncbi:MAG: bleomycin resistance family protein [Opitutaceae bacterium]|jgi:catechol 2,3-dioxygenase-like lactoylglutathione lyase family enzyme|nr:bleomycin resistance family protein [Opitutaceae bacterium]
MNVRNITPILNVSDMDASFTWFKNLGWTANWEWGEPVDFGCVGSGECEIFLSLNGQGGRGKGTNTTTFKTKGDDCLDKGVWLSVWVENVDEIHQLALDQGIEVVCEPEDMPWGIRECHLRHPDGHVFRVSKATC